MNTAREIWKLQLAALRAIHGHVPPLIITSRVCREVFGDEVPDGVEVNDRPFGPDRIIGLHPSVMVFDEPAMNRVRSAPSRGPRDRWGRL